MCTRQGAHKSHRISSSLCSHDNALLYLYWYLYFMLMWPWSILYYVWWEAIKLFWILNLESYCEYIYDFFSGTIPINFENFSVYLRRPPACITSSCMICMCSWVWSPPKIYIYVFFLYFKGPSIASFTRRARWLSTYANKLLYISHTLTLDLLHIPRRARMERWFGVLSLYSYFM